MVLETTSLGPVEEITFQGFQRGAFWRYSRASKKHSFLTPGSVLFPMNDSECVGLPGLVSCMPRRNRTECGEGIKKESTFTKLVEANKETCQSN